MPALPQKVLYALSACLRGNPLAQQVFFHQQQAQRLQQDLYDTAGDTAHGRKQILRILQLGHDLLAEWQDVSSRGDDKDEPSEDGSNNAADSAAVVEEYRQTWVTPAWCNVVLDKSRVLTRADKRLPILSAWYPYCQTLWDWDRLQELLVLYEDDVDDDTKTLRQDLLQQIATDFAAKKR